LVGGDPPFLRTYRLAAVPGLFFLWLPIGLLSKYLYGWMSSDPAQGPRACRQVADLHHHRFLGRFARVLRRLVVADQAVLKFWSLEQDKDGSARCTYKLRFWSSVGIFLFAFSLTFASIMWMKALHHQWFSTMYAVCYFAGSVWMALAMVYVITMVLDRQRILNNVLHEHQFYFLGSLMFAFTVFYAYVTFAQYFIIWNATCRRKRFNYVIRERASGSGEHARHLRPFLPAVPGAVAD